MSEYKNEGQDYDNVRDEDYNSARVAEQDSKKKSSYNAKGSRYFKVDDGYDKRVYENDWKNILIIIGVFIIYFGCNILYWWGMVAFGTAHPDAAQWYSVAVFIFTCAWIVGMLISGYYANKKLYRYEYYLEKINDKNQEIKEREQREAQKREQERKIAEQNKAKGGKTYKGDDDLRMNTHDDHDEEHKENLETMRDNDPDHHSHLLEDL